MTLRAEGVSVTRGGLPLLENLTFEVQGGAALILRGPNGSGKTTLLRTLAGLQPAERGAITPGPDAIAYAAHADGLKPTLTVTENLTFWARIFGTDGIDAALRAFDLAPLIDRPAAALSAGQKRRLGLARLLVTGRPIWLLDEPTVSLDAAATDAFAATIRGHLAAGGIAVIATHIDLGLAGDVLDITPFKARRTTDHFAEAWS